MSKYRSRKVTVDGLVFDSAKEARRYRELSLLEKAGAITGLTLQFKFCLIPAHYENVFDPRTGKSKRKCIERECSYIADFVYYEGGQMVVEDTKGFKTKEYIIKRKLMLWVYGIKVKEV